MIQKLYLSGNYIIKDDGTKKLEYDANDCVFTERSGNFVVFDSSINVEFTITHADSVNWADAEDGIKPYTEEKLRFFLRQNTGGDKTIDVVIQDSTSPLIIIKATETILDTTITTNMIIDAYSITLASVVGVLVGHQLTIFSPITKRYSVFTILGIVGNIITVDNPIDFAYSSGDFAQVGNTNLAVNGSVTPKMFSIRNTSAADIDISLDFSKIIISMQTTSLGNYNEFGNITKLTKGLVCRVINGRIENIFNIKNNREIDNLMFDFKFIATKGSAQDGLSARFKVKELGAVIRVKPLEDIKFIVQDDLTLLSIFEISVQGSVVVD